MNEKIRVVCGECDKKLACPASAAGRKVKCPSCGTTIRVPGADRGGETSGTPTRKKRRAPETGAGRRRRPSAAGNDNPYQSPAPGSADDMPPRSKKGAKRSKKKPASGDLHWSRKMIVGAGIMGASLASNAVQLAIQGPPNMRTAEGKGQALGQAFVTIGGLIFGLVIVVRSFRANRGKN
ncbi:hypothetical protein [Fuerstiella marisgermanici]|nr:hypothetical protein [Fuerstiella marisgermanici]